MPATTPSPALIPTPAKRLSAAAVTVLVALMALAGAAGAQDYPPRAVISVTTPGATITIESPNADWGPGTRVRINYRAPNGTQATRQATVNEDGTFATDLTVPDDAEPGVSQVTVSGVDAQGEEQAWEPDVLVQAEEPVAVESPTDGTEVAQAGDADGAAAGAGEDAAGGDAPEEATSASGLPTTGQGTAAWAFAAVLLVVVGSATVMGAQILTARRHGWDR